MKTSVAFMPLLLLTAGFCFASDIIYDVDQTVGVGNVTGFIETNGTIGVLDASDILNWNLLLNDGTTTFDLLGPLSGSNSQFGLSGSDLSASATQLLFDFSGSGDAIFQAPTLFTGLDYWCTQGTPPYLSGITCSAGTPNGSSLATGEVLITSSTDEGQVSGLSGTDVIASVSSVPEPSTLLLTGVCFLGILTRSLWRRSFR